MSIRGLARKIDPANLDRARRNLHRWLDEGMTPNRSSRRSVAAALGLDPDEFASLEDDEESDPVTDLFNALRRVVRAEIAEARP